MKTAAGPSAAVGQALEAAILVAAEDLVAGLAGNAELTAQRRRLFNDLRVIGNPVAHVS
jgi:hypothetical protein